MKSTIPCPYPGTCEFDDFRRSGNHFCMRVTCPYALTVRALLEGRKSYLDENKGCVQRGSEGVLGAPAVRGSG